MPGTVLSIGKGDSPPSGDGDRNDSGEIVKRVLRRPFFPYGGNLLSFRAATVLLLAALCVTGLTIAEMSGMGYFVSKFPLGGARWVTAFVSAVGWGLFIFLLDSVISTADIGYMYGLPMPGGAKDPDGKRKYAKVWGPILVRLGMVTFSIVIIAPELGKLVYRHQVEEIRRQANVSVVAKYADSVRVQYWVQGARAEEAYRTADSLYRCEIKGANCDGLSTTQPNEGKMARSYMVARARADTAMRQLRLDSAAFAREMAASDVDAIIARRQLKGLPRTTVTSDSIYAVHFKGSLQPWGLGFDPNPVQILLAFLVLGLVTTKMLGGIDLAIYTSAYHQALYSGPYATDEDFNKLLNIPERHPNFGGEGLSPTLFVQRMDDVAERYRLLSEMKTEFTDVQAQSGVSRESELKALKELEGEVAESRAAVRSAGTNRARIAESLSRVKMELARAVSERDRESQVVAGTQAAIEADAVVGAAALALAYRQLAVSTRARDEHAAAVVELERQRQELEPELSTATAVLQDAELELGEKTTLQASLRKVHDERRRRLVAASHSAMQRPRAGLKVG